MAAKIVRKQPEAPSARLYLDDIQEVIALVQDGFSKLEQPSRVTFTYRADEYEYANIEELVGHGGSPKIFELICTDENGRSVSVLSNLYGWKIYGPYTLPDDVKNEIVRSFNLILQHRKRRLHTLLRDIVSKTSFSLINGILIGTIFADPMLWHLKNHLWIGLALPFQVLGLMVFCGVTYVISSSQGRLNLYFKRAGERRRAAKGIEVAEKLGYAIFGALLGVLGTLAAQKLK